MNSIKLVLLAAVSLLFTIASSFSITYSTGENTLLDKFQKLKTFNNEILIKAMVSTNNAESLLCKCKNQ